MISRHPVLDTGSKNSLFDTRDGHPRKGARLVRSALLIGPLPKRGREEPNPNPLPADEEGVEDDLHVVLEPLPALLEIVTSRWELASINHDAAHVLIVLVLRPEETVLDLDIIRRELTSKVIATQLLCHTGRDDRGHGAQIDPLRHLLEPDSHHRHVLLPPSESSPSDSYRTPKH